MGCNEGWVTCEIGGQFLLSDRRYNSHSFLSARSRCTLSGRCRYRCFAHPSSMEKTSCSLVGAGPDTARWLPRALRTYARFVLPSLMRARIRITSHPTVREPGEEHIPPQYLLQNGRLDGHADTGGRRRVQCGSRVSVVYLAFCGSINAPQALRVKVDSPQQWR